jgi:hypothetical protein
MSQTWTRVSAPADTDLLPAWFVQRMVGARGGSFGLLLTTGDVLRVLSLTAVHLSSSGTVLLDLSLDHAGVPEGVDTAWRSKHYLGAPVSTAAAATVNLTQIVAVVEFAAPVGARLASEASDSTSATVVELRQVAENAVRGSTTE